MRKVFHRCRLVCLTVAALTVAGGCQSGGTATRAPYTLTEDSLARVTDRQAADVQVALGRSLEKRGDLDQASRAYGEALRRDSHRTDAMLRLAILHDQRGEFKASAELYSKALQLSPGNADIFCDMGYSLYLQRRWAEAEMNLQQALALKPKLARAHNNLGLVLAHTDRLDQALVQFRLAGSEADAQLNLGLALAMDERWDEARTHYQHALELNPNLERAKTGLHELDQMLARAPSATPEHSGTSLPTPNHAAAKPAIPSSVSADLPSPIAQVGFATLGTTVDDATTIDSQSPTIPASLSVLSPTPSPRDLDDTGPATVISVARTFFRLP